MEISCTCNTIKQVNQMLHRCLSLFTVTVTGSLSAFSQFRQSLNQCSLVAIFVFGRPSPLLTFFINGMSGLDILRSSSPTAEVKPLSEIPLCDFIIFIYPSHTLFHVATYNLICPLDPEVNKYYIYFIGAVI